MLFLLHISSWIAWRHGEIIDVDFNFLGPSKKGIHTVYTSWPRQQVVYACTYVPHHVLQCTHNNTLACFVQGHTNIYAPWVISKGISLLEPPLSFFTSFSCPIQSSLLIMSSLTSQVITPIMLLHFFRVFFTGKKCELLG
jgi:hypothetical protein